MKIEVDTLYMEDALFIRDIFHDDQYSEFEAIIRVAEYLDTMITVRRLSNDDNRQEKVGEE